MELLEGRYEMTELLGKGGMGEVWDGYDKRLDRPVAVKLMRNGIDERPVSRERFKREAQVMARLEHPGVPLVYDAGLLRDGRVYLTMQRVHGRTLSEVLTASGPLPLSWVAAITAQVSEVLAYAHALGVIHRDLKPSNLMLTRGGQIKVLDFGIAAALDPDPDSPVLTVPGRPLGTPGYFSPEQVRGQRATQRSDLYALGWVLYELITGRLPLSGAPLELFAKRLQEEPLPVSRWREGVPAPLDGLVTSLLAVDPEDRPESAGAVQALAEPWIGQFTHQEAAQRHAAAVADLPTADGGSVPAYDPTVPYTRLLGAVLSAREPHTPEPSPAPTAPEQPQAANAPVIPDRVRELTDEGRNTQAAALLAQVVTDLRGRFHATHPHLITARLELYGLQRKAGELESAYEGYQELGALLETERDSTDPDALRCRAGAAACLGELGRTAEAIEAYRGLVPLQQSALGEQAGEVFDSRYELAVLVAGRGGVAEAVGLLRALRNDQSQALPEGDVRHRRVAELLDRLERLFRTMSGEK
ncbi:serine/threonine-protein kinase [Streptomyces smyrnaeus]|uniref:serine/threonine-protein kinase n=1 Tax=Streptomyces smyrnaeus TaxID=1387713 RepID=UPI00369DB731